MPSIADNRYVGWVYEFGESKAEVGVPTDNPVLPQLVDTSDVRHQTVKVVVDSAYRLGISPAVGARDMQLDPSGGSLIQFKAPEFIYLDRFRNEIGTSDQPNPEDFLDRAYYRARNIGYAGPARGGHRLPGNPPILQPAPERADQRHLALVARVCGLHRVEHQRARGDRRRIAG